MPGQGRGDAQCLHLVAAARDGTWHCLGLTSASFVVGSSGPGPLNVRRGLGLEQLFQSTWAAEQLSPTAATKRRHLCSLPVGNSIAQGTACPTSWVGAMEELLSETKSCLIPGGSLREALRSSLPSPARTAPICQLLAPGRAVLQRQPLCGNETAAQLPPGRDTDPACPSELLEQHLEDGDKVGDSCRQFSCWGGVRAALQPCVSVLLTLPELLTPAPSCPLQLLHSQQWGCGGTAERWGHHGNQR